MTELELFGNINGEAWEMWSDWRRLEKRKKITPTAEKLQKKLLSAYSHEQQQAIIEHSITNDYQGLFPPKGGAASPNSTKNRTLQQDLTDRSWAN